MKIRKISTKTDYSYSVGNISDVDGSELVVEKITQVRKGRYDIYHEYWYSVHFADSTAHCLIPASEITSLIYDVSKEEKKKTELPEE